MSKATTAKATVKAEKPAKAPAKAEKLSKSSTPAAVPDDISDDPAKTDPLKAMKAEDKKAMADYPGFKKRPRVISRFPYGPNNESHLVELEAATNCNGSVFVEGVAGVGVVSTVVAATLIKQLSLPLVAVFESPELPQMASVHSFRATAPFRIYGDSTVCVATGDVPISAASKSHLIWQIVRAFTDFARRHKCTHIVTVEGNPIKAGLEKEFKSIAKLLPKGEGGFGGSTSTDEDTEKKVDEDESEEDGDPFATVKFITCDEAIGKKLKEMGHGPVRTGQIVGLTGGLLQWSFTAPLEDPPVTCLLAAAPQDLPDQRGALLAVKVLRELFSLADLDITELESETTRLGEKIKATIEDIKTQITSQLKQMQPAAPPTHMYM
jgi:predicted ATP-grasp superfamily ATP-dependent carboligase